MSISQWPLRAALALSLFCLAALAACGPREIGAGSADESPVSAGGSPAAEMMRFPMTGASARERLLYLHNRPDVMQQMQDWRLQTYQRRLRRPPSPEDPAYRAQPKQPSPFRQ